MTTNFGRQEELTHVRLIKQVPMTLSHQDHVTNLKHLHYQSAFGHQTWQDGIFLDELLLIKPYDPFITWPCKMIKTIISTTTVPMATKLGRAVTYP